MNIKEVKNYFIEKFNEDVLNRTSFKTLDKFNSYFKDDYKDALIIDMNNNNVYDCFKDLEFKDFKNGRTKICKITSSSRLCYLYFSGLYDIKQNPSDYVFEDTSFTFIGDNNNLNCAHFDFRKDTHFYECKCEEFFRKHTDYLASHFYKKLLKESFEIDNEIEDINDKLYPTLRQLNIDKDGDIYSYHFDVKQLLTHLLALKNRKQYVNDFVTLEYVWFYPRISFIDNEEMITFKNMISEEFNSLNNSSKINRFCHNHKIILKFSIKEAPDELVL